MGIERLQKMMKRENTQRSSTKIIDAQNLATIRSASTSCSTAHKKFQDFLLLSKEIQIFRKLATWTSQVN